MQCSEVQCSEMQCSEVHCSEMQCSAVQFDYLSQVPGAVYCWRIFGDIGDISGLVIIPPVTLDIAHSTLHRTSDIVQYSVHLL